MVPWGSQAHWPFICAFLCFAESLSGEPQCTLCPFGPQGTRPAALVWAAGSIAQVPVGKVGAWGGAWGSGTLWAQEQRVTLGKPLPFMEQCFAPVKWVAWGTLPQCTLESLADTSDLFILVSDLRSPGSHLGLPGVGSAPLQIKV